MASDDRDPQLEKALARHFRAASDSADHPAQPRSAHPEPCPDPELLAAYHERNLLAGEMATWKQHIVGCSHCQTILGDLERTDAITLGVPQEHTVAASPQGRPRAAVLYGSRWKWLAPAGAIAASLLVWVAWQEGSKSTAVKSGPVEMARVQEPQAPTQQEYRSSPASPPQQRESKLGSPKPTGAARPVPAEVFPSVLSGKDHANARSRGASAPIPSDRKSDKPAASRNEELGIATQTVEVRGAAPALQESEAQTLKKEAELRDQQPNLQYQNMNQIAADASKVPGPAPANQAAPVPAKAPSVAREKAKNVPSAPLPAPASAGYLDSATVSALEIVSASDPRLILASDGITSWRAGRAGSIEFSVDEGKTWTSQYSGVLTDLLTGSAPSASICWIVGRAGTVIVTTDGGAHWKLVKIPVTEDLGGVRASDALRATIWNSRKTQYFQTRDGGQTWQPATAP